MADFYLVGGDGRQRHLAQRLREAGHRVRLFGVGALGQDALTEADVIWLPVPSLRKGKIPGESGTSLDFEKAIPWIAGRGCIFYGDEATVAQIRACEPRWMLNLAEDEIFLRENARITAEGAVVKASAASEQALWQRRCLVVGYGRIGKALTGLLLRLGAKVTVCARKSSARAEARLAGAQVCDASTLPAGADIVFNTAPARMIPVSSWGKLLGEGLYVELASAPYGADPEKLMACGLSTLHLPGIPGSLYPQTAANILYSALLRGTGPEILPTLTSL